MIGLSGQKWTNTLFRKIEKFEKLGIILPFSASDSGELTLVGFGGIRSAQVGAGETQSSQTDPVNSNLIKHVMRSASGTNKQRIYIYIYIYILKK